MSVFGTSSQLKFWMWSSEMLLDRHRQEVYADSPMNLAECKKLLHKYLTQQVALCKEFKFPDHIAVENPIECRF